MAHRGNKNEEDAAMLDSLGGFLQIIGLLAVIGLSLCGVLVWLSIHLLEKRIMAEDPKQFRGMPRKNR